MSLAREVQMFFSQVEQGPPDAIFGMSTIFDADPRKDKISLMVGVYKDEHLASSLLPSVKLAKERITPKDQLANYLGFEGLPTLGDELGKLVFGTDLWSKNGSRTYSAQSLGGTGALRVGAEFLAQEVGKSIHLPKPTWGNHQNIFARSGLEIQTIPYYSVDKHGFDAEAYISKLQTIASGSIILFHAACHNPTGSDPTMEDWKEISRICLERSLFPFFDFAYQGFGDGLDEDAKVVRYFMEQGHEMMVAYSCSKNFSLYSQRIGCLFVVCSNEDVKGKVASQINRIIRAMYSNGGRIVLEVLTTDLSTMWKHDVERMRNRINDGHQSLSDALISRAKHRDFSFAKSRKGMFSYLDLSPAERQKLIDLYGVYTLDGGRISVAGLTPGNIESIADKIIAVCES
jgi:aspartate/tyrosine/aromatic aminotransferase